MPPKEPPHPTVSLAIEAWNLAGGFDWTAMPMLCELYGYADPEILIAQMAAIRDWQSDHKGN